MSGSFPPTAPGRGDGSNHQLNRKVMKKMTFGEMNAFTKRFNGIANSQSSSQSKEERLEILKSDLEGAYDIRGERLKRSDSALMQFYHTVGEVDVYEGVARVG